RFVHFEGAGQELVPAVSIQKLDDSFQLARAEVTSPLVAVTEPVLSAATHAFRLQGSVAPRWRILEVGLSIADPLVCDHENVERLFAALRIVTGVPTGIAQLLAQPIGQA